MAKFLRDCFTGVDCQTFDLGRVLWAVCFTVWAAGALLFLGLEAVSVLTKWERFDMVAFGTGFAGIVVTGAGLLPAGGFGLRIKADVEPKQSQ
jgi:hypothetical protein